jgi:hypothetical protein
MQRSLAYALSPAPGLPLRFLLAAPWFGVLAGLMLLAGADSAFVSRWSPSMLGATHLLTLGYLGMSMAGSILQLIPVVTGVALWLGRVWAALAWSGLTLGCLLLASALGLGAASLFAPAALLLGGALAILIVVFARALLRRASAPALPIRWCAGCGWPSAAWPSRSPPALPWPWLSAVSLRSPSRCWSTCTRPGGCWDGSRCWWWVWHSR